MHGVDAAQARLDAIKTGLSVGAGIGGAVALLLAHLEGDAAVRMAGLYALERLAQSHPAHRQTVVNVIRAYLRMPFDPPNRG